MKPTPAKAPPWLPDVEEHDHPTAESYLSLIYPAKRGAGLVAELRAAGLQQFKAEDIFRACGLSLFGVSNSHVAKDRAKMRAGTRLSPLLLARDERSGELVIANGYHRLCAVYEVDEDALVPCKIV